MSVYKELETRFSSRCNEKCAGCTGRRNHNVCNKHDEHSDYPLALETKKIASSMFRPFMNDHFYANRDVATNNPVTDNF